ncbi:MAG: 2OG-Fe(II) oxygenase [Acetobacteraceae bacterium]
MPSETAALAKLLATVTRPGDFYSAGTAELWMPALDVDGVGPIALPLLPAQAQSLIGVAEAAPYGRGQETRVDPTVRRTWQIGPDRVRIGGRHWPRTLAAIVTRVAAGLGVDEPIDAEFYKLLIYNRGSFFIGHRDTEKVAGMFATLVIVLPSQSDGGELRVAHGGREVSLDLRSDDPAEVAFAAFYADCVHEVLPVTDGCRLTLVYNLLRRQGRGRPPEPPSYRIEQARLAAMLRAWGDAERPPARAATFHDAESDEAGSGAAIPEKLVYPLEHAYTPAGLGFAGLKGRDAAVAGVLAAATPEAGCELYLALLTIEENGLAEHTGGYDDEDEFDVVEASERWAALSDWRGPMDETPSFNELPVDEGVELSPPGVLDELDPDDEHFHEATGNEGASYERTYRRAALVIWPRRRRLAVFCQAGPDAALTMLEDALQRVDAARGDQRRVLLGEAHELAGHITDQWAERQAYRPDDAEPGVAARMLTLLARLGSAPAIEAFVARATLAGDYRRSDNPALLAALALLPPPRQAKLLDQIVERCAPTALGACAALLAGAVGRVPDLRKAARRLVQAMPGDPAKADARFPRRRVEITPQYLTDLLETLPEIDPAVAADAVRHVLAWPDTYPQDRLLVPVLRKMRGREPALAPLRAACLAHLRARAAEPLAPPMDWRRASTVACRCEHCRDLARFLVDPAQKVWMLRAAAPVRAHVEQVIRNAAADVDAMTESRGRPYSLFCTKNQASYDRRAAQREQDLKDIARLEG